MFENFDYSSFKNMPPPKDGSLRSLSEIKDLQNITLDKKEINNLSDSSASVILKLKKYYNRPRPKDQAKQYGLELENVELASMKTPSYPSGHSAQGILIGNYLADKYKDEDFKKIGNEISDARNVARAHYKSDSDMGKKLGQAMYNYIKNG